MATVNSTAVVKKAVDTLTNQEVLDNILNKSVEIEGADSLPTVELAGMILRSPEGSELVQWFLDINGHHQEEVASTLASLLIAARISPVQLPKLDLPIYESVLVVQPRTGKVIPFQVPPSRTGATPQQPNGAA